MTTRTKIFTTLAVATVVALGGGAYVAQATTDEAGAVMPRLAEKLATLGVTDEQKAEVKAILRKHQPAVEPLIKQVVAERRTLRDTIRAETIDEAGIRAQAAKVASLEADLAVQRAHVAHEIRAVLTPEQLEKLKETQVDVDARIDHVLHRIAKRIAED
jgi:protein CpxP